MQKNKGLMIIILTIVLATFVAFVIIMQHNFMNPEFATAEVSQTEKSETNNDTDINDEEEVSSESDGEEETEEEREIVSPQYVTAELLNVREGPSLETEIVGVVTLNQEVEVEDVDNPDNWVKITTDDFTGYVNLKFLSEEEQ